MTNREQLLALADRAEKAEGADRELDWQIQLLTDPRAPGTCQMHYDPAYTASVDAALMLYKHKPDMVSSCPRKVCADALRQRIALLDEGNEG